MPLTQVTTATTVYATAPGGQTGYNDVRGLLVDILGTGSNGYGYRAIPSVDVSTSNLIAAAQWNNLVSNSSLIYQHHNNATPTITNQPVSGQNVGANFVNQLITIINGVETVRYNRPPAGQRSTYDAPSQWTVSSPSRLTWGALIEHEITLTWDNNDDARYFFNLGGRLSFSLTYPVESYNSDDLKWTALIDGNASAMSNYVYARSDFLSGNKTTSWSDIDGNEIEITYTKVDNRTVRLLLSLSNAGLATNLEVTNTFSYEYSTGAITAPQPSVTVQQSLGDTTVPIVVPTKILSVSTPSAYTWVTGSTSAAQTVSITNSGNSTATISSITFSNAAGISQVTNFTGLGDYTLNPSQTKTFTLAYTGTPIGGPYNSSFTVNSNNDSGPITIQTTQSVTNVPFSFSVTPTSVSTNLYGLTIFRQDFIITSNNGDTFTYTASFTSSDAPPGSVGWSVSNSQPTGPSVEFSPAGFASGTYTASATLQINATGSTTGSDSVNVPLTIYVEMPSTYNLGTWVSPLAPDNSVVGISYDIIGGERYITIGVGMGADGSIPISVGGDAFVDVANLGVNADPEFTKGQRQYAVTDINNDWCLFLKNYGVWPNIIPRYPLNVDVGITAFYKIYFPVSGTYTFQYSSDDDSLFRFYPCDEYGIIPNDVVPIYLPNQLLTGSARSNWRTSYFVSVYFNQGYYQLNYYHNNTGLVAAAAFEIYDPNGSVIWNTRYPLKYSTPYLYWQDVTRYRIPANGVVRDGVSSAALYSSNSYVKNSYQVANNSRHWGFFFSGDMFKITEDGAGNVEISFFGAARAPNLSEVANDSEYVSTINTLRALPASFYYYLPYEVLPRYTNLDPGPVGDGTQTRYFKGFDRNGNVITVLANIPEVIPQPQPPTGGGGGELYNPFDPDIGIIFLE